MSVDNLTIDGVRDVLDELVERGVLRVVGERDGERIYDVVPEQPEVEA